MASDEITVEVWHKPANDTQGGPGTYGVNFN